MVNIWLDDERDPTHQYPVAMGGLCCSADVDWLWYQDAESLIWRMDAIGMDDINILSLDHDLGNELVDRGRGPKAWYPKQTGYDVICWIEAMVVLGKRPPSTILIHTQNPVGRDKMIAARASIYRRAYSL